MIIQAQELIDQRQTAQLVIQHAHDEVAAEEGVQTEKRTL